MSPKSATSAGQATTSPTAHTSTTGTMRSIVRRAPHQSPADDAQGQTGSGEQQLPGVRTHHSSCRADHDSGEAGSPREQLTGCHRGDDRCDVGVLEAERLVVAEEDRQQQGARGEDRRPGSGAPGEPHGERQGGGHGRRRDDEDGGQQPGQGGHDVDQRGQPRGVEAAAGRPPDRRHERVPRPGVALVGVRQPTTGPLLGDEHEVADVVATEEPLDAVAVRQEPGRETVRREDGGGEQGQRQDRSAASDVDARPDRRRQGQHDDAGRCPAGRERAQPDRASCLHQRHGGREEHHEGHGHSRRDPGDGRSRSAGSPALVVGARPRVRGLRGLAGGNRDAAGHGSRLEPWSVGHGLPEGSADTRRTVSAVRPFRRWCSVDTWQHVWARPRRASSVGPPAASRWPAVRPGVAMTLAPPISGTAVVPRPARLDTQLVKFAVVGVASTVTHLGIFATLHQLVDAQPANLAALVLATIGNTAVNRRWTFGVTGSSHRGRQHLQALLVFALAWALSATALWALPQVWHDPSTAVSTVAVGASMALSTVVRFVLMRTWIFRSTT